MSDMDFELMLRQFFGDKAWHSASSAFNKKSRNQWFRKIEKKILANIESIDTTERHKSLLLQEVEQSFSLLRKENQGLNSIFSLLMLISRLLGYDYCKSAKLHSLCYFQTEDQYYIQRMFENNDALEKHSDTKDIISQRASIAKALKKDGKTTLRIGQILGVSEYKVKQLIKDF